MALILPRRFTSQPQGAVEVDWSNPLAEGLTFDFDPITRADRLKGGATNNGATFGPTQKGISASFARASSQYVSFGDRADWDVGSGNFSFEFLFRMASAATGATRMQLLSKDAVGARQIWTEINTVDTGTTTENSVALVWLNGTLHQSRTPANSLTVGKWHHVIYQRRGNDVDAWIDGVPQTITKMSDNYPAVAATATAVELGSRAYTTNRDFFDGDIALARFRSRALLDVEARALADNAWQLYRRAPLVMPTTTAASGAYSLNVDATSYALSFSNPTLKADRKLSVDATSYSITYANPTLKADRKLDVTATSYALTFANPALTYAPGSTYSLNVDATSFALTFANPLLLRTYVADVTATSYALTFSDPTLSYATADGWSVVAEASSTWTVQTPSSNTWTEQ